MPRTKGAHTRRITLDNSRYKAWQTMRLYKKRGHVFALAELAATDPKLKADNIKVYCRGLVRHGYLQIVVAKANGRRGGHALYRLERDTGPRPPRLHQNGGLFDPNLDMVLEPNPARGVAAPLKQNYDRSDPGNSSHNLNEYGNKS